MKRAFKLELLYKYRLLLLSLLLSTTTQSNSFHHFLIPRYMLKQHGVKATQIRQRLKNEWQKRNFAPIPRITGPRRKPSGKCPPTCDRTKPPKRPSTAGGSSKKHDGKSTNLRSRLVSVDIPVIRGSKDGVSGSLQPDVNTQQTTAEKPELDAESSAKTCSRCSKILKPSKGKKIAYRRRTGKWMYVHKDAPIEYSPLDEQEDAERQVNLEEKDDEEPLPQGEAKSNIEPSAESIVQNEQGQDSVVENLTAPETGGADAAPAETSEQLTSHIRGPVSTDQSSSLTQETAKQHGETSTAETAAEFQSQQQPEGEIETTTASTPPEHIPRESTAALPTPRSDTIATPAPVEQVQPAEVIAQGEKRKSETEHETPVGKKQRIDVDLTIDDDDEPVIIKAEPGHTSADRASVQQEADDRYELEQVERELRIEELRKRQAELKHKLSKNKGREGKAAIIKDEPVIKIED